MIELEIFGRPEPLNSTKVARNGHFYNPKQKEIDKSKWQLKSQYNGELIKGAVELKVNYYFRVPKGTSCVKRKQMLANIIKHTKRPDRGNLDKFVEDVLKGTIIADDSQVWKLTGTKLWCADWEREKTIIYAFPEL